jgi:hypothetical protein
LKIKGKKFFVTGEAPLWKCIRQQYTLLTAFLAHASLDSTVNQSAVVDLVFEHRELSRENMEIFIAPQGVKLTRSLIFHLTRIRSIYLEI